MILQSLQILPVDSYEDIYTIKAIEVFIEHPPSQLRLANVKC